MSRPVGPLNGPPKPAVVSSQEFIVRIPKATKRRHHVMRFMQSRNQTPLEWSQVRMERENNLKEYRTESDELPKYGAGSEYGRELKDEARRKKFGIVRKKYNPDDQPWHLRVGGKQGKKFKGIREGGVMENASYYVFSKAPDGVFEAYPVDEWYNFTPIQRYKALTAEEAEDAYSQRDKIINHFAIMVKKRLAEAQGTTFEEDKDGASTKEPGSSSKKSRESLKLTDMDDWHGDSDFSGAESGGDNAEEEAAKKKKKRKDQKKKDKKSQESDSSAQEESDEGDFDGREVSYMTSGSESSGDEPEDEKVNKQLKGVEDEDALRQLVLSDEDDDEDDENKKDEDDENKNEDGDKTGDGKGKDGKKSSGGDKDSGGKGGSDRGANKNSAGGGKSSDESSSENSDSDLDDSRLLGSSAVFMQGKRKDGGSRSGTPTKDVINGTNGILKKVKAPGGSIKRKKEETPTKEGQGTSTQGPSQHGTQQSHLPSAGLEQATKKPKIELNLGINLNNGGSSSSSNNSSTVATVGPSGSRGGVDNTPLAQVEGINEEAVRRYLMRKPMTTTELLQKFKSKKTGLTSDQLVNLIAQILKRLNPEKQKIKDKLYLSIRQ
ncbi:general transcription factor IIF subunit 1-like isoform X2 [Varroa jacobsoni]|uniref:Transcription initiation factor IIF subunit alpha n=1 Tax=Varroa destructor TaxID=109461 RepID=A0A7M7L7R3_VARDE|nr:general transcription factor IIF subunit 1-like isoform X2 [Varroa destructor]XP_022696189.1 general transcription factor IIF subunit 1-like isoform X2 [Varroa jacobsoni]